MQIPTLPKWIEVYIEVLNQLFELDKKIKKIQEPNSMHRNLNRVYDLMGSRLPVGQGEEMGLLIEDPFGQPYNETRTDCEASIAGEGTENLSIIEVLKPIIRLKQGQYTQIVQKAVVIVSSQN